MREKNQSSSCYATILKNAQFIEVFNDIEMHDYIIIDYLKKMNDSYV